MLTSSPKDAAVREVAPMLVGLARRLTKGNASDADDLVQDTFEKALRAIDRYDDRGNLRGWLAAILHRNFLDRCRSVRRAPAAESIDTHELPAPEPVTPPRWAEITTEHVESALTGMRAELRSAYQLHRAGRSYDEIAAELGIPKSTVGTRLLRARKQLRSILLAA